MTRKDVTNTKEYQLAKLAMEWFAAHDDDVDALDGYEAGYQQAIEHPTGGELLHVLNKGHEQGWKDAVEKACEYLKTSHEDIGIRYIRGHEVEDEIEIFKKYMGKQQ